MSEVAGLFGLGARRLGIAPYAEMAETPGNLVDRWAARRQGWIEARLPFPRWRLARRARRILALGAGYAALDDDALRAAATALRGALLAAAGDAAAVDRAFAIVREVSARRLGKRHFPVQLMGGLALFEGRMVEMATGEGKTLTAVPAAVVAALAGQPVHVVTVNDYLAERDARDLEPVYAFFGLTVGVVLSETDEAARRAAYACDVTYVANKNLTFDYLRDRVALGARRGLARRLAGALAAPRAPQPLFLRGLAFAIVDEADSVFVDEARTPLILSRMTSDPALALLYEQALALARGLRPNLDFRLDALGRHASLTERGKRQVAATAPEGGGLWRIRRAREELVVQALSALHHFQRGRDYVILDDTVQIVDEFTGRVMPDRSWQSGLHQMIEVKEGVPVTGQKETLAQITYQRFFRRYRRLAGMTGTGIELAGEFREVFGLVTLRIPTHRRRLRRDLRSVFFRSASDRWDAVARRVAGLRASGRPVLVGTRSVEASDRASAALDRLGIPHAVLNARQHAEEAAIVARAGAVGAVTVATNMAGRGTDIPLDPEARRLGGLHVILTEYHESARIDRQLYGRAGRQGDPGSTEAMVALDDELFTRYAPRLSRLARLLPLAPFCGLVRRLAQARAERENATTRRDQTVMDRDRERAMAFAGPLE